MQVSYMNNNYMSNQQQPSTFTSSSLSGPSSDIPNLTPTSQETTTDLQFSNTYNFMGIISFGKTTQFDHTQLRKISGSRTIDIPDG